MQRIRRCPRSGGCDADESERYQHENGGEGSLWVKKYQMIPRSAAGCRIEYHADDLFNGSGEFETSGTVRVFKRGGSF